MGYSRGRVADNFALGGKKTMRRTLAMAFITGFALVAMITPVSYAQDINRKALRVNGAVTASDEVKIWAEAFTEVNPEIRVVVAGSTVSKGLDDLLAGNVDIVTSGRSAFPAEEKKAAEKGMRLEYRTIGYSAVAVITSPRNPINALTLDQLREIFTDEYSNWKKVGGPDAPIRCLVRRIPDSGSTVFFKQEVLRNKPFGPNTEVMDDWRLITRVCSDATDMPIGIVPMRGPKRRAKLLAVKADDKAPGTLPSEKTLELRSYPIINAIRLYWNGHATDERVRKFVDFCEIQGLQIK